MSRLILIPIIFIFSYIISCDFEKGTDNTLMKESKKIVYIADSIFFGRIECIREYNKNIFLSDYKTNKIYCLDSNFNLIRTIGKEGSGPREFRGVSKFEIKNDQIIVYAEHGRRISIFSLEGAYLSGFTCPIGGLSMSKYAVDSNNNLYISSPRKEFPISIVNLNGDIIGEFGEWFIPKEKRQKSSRNYRYLEIDSDGNLICIYISEPIIEKYSLNGQLLSRLDLRDNLFISKRVKFNEESYSREKSNPMIGSTYLLFRDINIKDHFIYLLYYDHNKKLNNILVLENNKEKFIFKNNITLNLDEDEIPYIGSFCINDANEIIGFCSRTGSLFQFDVIQKNENF